MHVWITTVTTTKSSGINTLWAAIIKENFIPERVHLINLTGEKKNNSLKDSKNGYDCLLRRYGIQTKLIIHHMTETDFSAIAKKMNELVNTEKLEGNTVALDMTPGRKYMSAFTLAVGAKYCKKMDRIYYLHVKGTQPREAPLPLIPSNFVTLYDLLPILKARGTK